MELPFKAGGKKKTKKKKAAGKRDGFGSAYKKK